MRNPDWNREELILALDLYHKLDYGQMHARNEMVIELSKLLKTRQELLNINVLPSFRSSSSVSRKLANFMRLDENYTDTNRKGLAAGGKLDIVVWNVFLENRAQLEEDAKKNRIGILKYSTQFEKNKFSEWLTQTVKSNGKGYSAKTVKMYTSQIESPIQKEWSLELSEGYSLFNIKDYLILQEFQTKLTEGIDSKYRKDLRSAFQSYLKYTRESQLNDTTELPEESESKTEGGKKVYVSKRAERNPKLRGKAIAFHKTICKVCEFDFGKTYGKWGEGFIEVHHLIPIGGKDSKERKTNPETDLTVVCANCHRMLHRRKDVTLTIDELKKKIKTPEV
jgi:predicted HNH restriction endonuclease